MHAMPTEAIEAIGIPGTGVAIGYEQPCGFASRAERVFSH